MANARPVLDSGLLPGLGHGRPQAIRFDGRLMQMAGGAGQLPIVAKIGIEPGRTATPARHEPAHTADLERTSSMTASNFGNSLVGGDGPSPEKNTPNTEAPCASKARTPRTTAPSLPG